MTDLIHQAITNELQAIPNIGMVYPYEPFHRQAQDLTAKYTWNGKIRGWGVVRQRLVEVPGSLGTLGNFKNVELIDWQIYGFWEVTDGGQSGQTFQDMLDLIREKFRNNRDLGIPGLTTITEERAGIEILTTGLANFAGAVVHATTLELTTQRYL
jgi:hypothetical protein